jgi:WhiB family redox-sensing transcriptional regulator
VSSPIPTNSFDAEDSAVERSTTTTSSSGDTVGRATANEGARTPSWSTSSSRLDSSLQLLIEESPPARTPLTIRPRSSRWQDKAACRGMGRFFFIPEYPLDLAAKLRVKRAKEVCATCPVAGACLSYAERRHLSGVWGGRLLAPMGGVYSTFHD